MDILISLAIYLQLEFEYGSMPGKYSNRLLILQG
jgi:hypothetical protein